MKAIQLKTKITMGKDGFDKDFIEKVFLEDAINSQQIMIGGVHKGWKGVIRRGFASDGCVAKVFRLNIKRCRDDKH